MNKKPKLRDSDRIKFVSANSKILSAEKITSNSGIKNLLSILEKQRKIKELFLPTTIAQDLKKQTHKANSSLLFQEFSKAKNNNLKTKLEELNNFLQQQYSKGNVVSPVLLKKLIQEIKTQTKV